MTETTQNPTPKRKAPRWMKVLLVISLAFNLLIIGAVASKAFMPHHRFGGKGIHKGYYNPLARPAALIRAGRHMMRQMPHERRHEMFQLVRKHRTNMQSDKKKLAAARLELARLMASQSDNQQNFDTAYTAVKQAEAATHEKTSAMVRDFIKNLTPTERTLYAEILQNPPRRRWFGHR